MEKPYTVLRPIRDLTLSFTLASLLVLNFYWISRIIAPEPQFEDFTCEYNNMSCRELDKVLRERHEELSALSARASKSPETSQKMKEEIAQLKAEIENTTMHLNQTREARDKLLMKARNEAHAKHLYLAIVMGLAALLGGFIIHILPLQIGLILGGLLILLSKFTLLTALINKWFMLIFLLAALCLVIATILKSQKKSS